MMFCSFINKFPISLRQLENRSELTLLQTNYSLRSPCCRQFCLFQNSVVITIRHYSSTASEQHSFQRTPEFIFWANRLSSTCGRRSTKRNLNFCLCLSDADAKRSGAADASMHPRRAPAVATATWSRDTSCAAGAPDAPELKPFDVFHVDSLSLSLSHSLQLRASDASSVCTKTISDKPRGSVLLLAKLVWTKLLSSVFIFFASWRS